ncbi:MAG: hypothetical protein DWQ06_02385 [Calditrichaeota bacterium]|nr:MAG: hypothetical protein DWQ06_02385 [Calditrichota bacterium]
MFHNRINRKENRGYLYEVSITEITNKIEKRFWELIREGGKTTQESTLSGSKNELGCEIPKNLEFLVWGLAEEKIQRICSLCKKTAKQVTQDIIVRLRERNCSNEEIFSKY